ncbi:MAG: TlpA family protein disulfide reductase [Chloroflexi bacterium]|nr:TlpA family protein disulfide reductase [Chloroflexota bacterium]
MPSRRARRAAAVLLLAAVVAGCSGGGTSTQGSTTPGTDASSGAGGPGASIAVGPTVGSLAPDLVLSDLDGKPVSLADFRGRPVVLNYWASWCGPCRDEFPALRAAADAHAADGLTVLGVLFKDDPAPARDFMAKEGATWTSLADPDGVGAAAYRVVAPPTTFFIDADGVVRGMQVGGMTADQIDRHLRTILP